jgi:hypothetical protein
MKKATTKPAASPAPATKSASAAKVPKPAAKKKAAAPAPASAAPAVQAVAAKPVETVITAQIDVGFGNQLYIRGEGPGLSWDKGVLMECVASDQWRVALPESARPVVFKFLVNDLSWSAGDDYKAEPGTSVTLTPSFF